MPQEMNPPSRTTGEYLRHRQALNARLSQSDSETHAHVAANGIPLVDDSAFATDTNHGQGASMDLYTGRVPKTGVSIGGESDAQGTPITTKYVKKGKHSAQLTGEDVSKHRALLQSKVGRKANLVLGSWVPDSGEIATAAAKSPPKDITGVNLDASGIYSEKKAPSVLASRPDEESGWNLAKNKSVFASKPKVTPTKKA